MLSRVKQVETFRWYLPPKPWQGKRAKPYLSSWHMDQEQAARQGAIGPEPTTLIMRDVAETPDEEAELLRRTDTSKSGGSWRA